MAVKLDIMNSALIKLGQEKILTDSDSTTTRGVVIVEQYPKILNRLLKDHSWNFNLKRTKMSLETFEISYTDIDATTDTFTQEKHGYVTGTKVQVSTDGVLPTGLSASTNYYVIKYTVDTFQLATSLANALAGTAINITATGSGTHTVTCQDYTPEFQYDYAFTLPSDYTRKEKITWDDGGLYNVDHKEEGGKMLSNDNPIYMLYVSNDTTVTNFPSDFAELLAFELAIECCYSLVQSKELKAQLEADRDKYKADVKFVDGFNSRVEDMQVDYFIRTRF